MPPSLTPSPGEERFPWVQQKSCTPVRWPVFLDNWRKGADERQNFEHLFMLASLHRFKFQISLKFYSILFIYFKNTSHYFKNYSVRASRLWLGYRYLNRRKLCFVISFLNRVSSPHLPSKKKKKRVFITWSLILKHSQIHMILEHLWFHYVLFHQDLFVVFIDWYDLAIMISFLTSLSVSTPPPPFPTLKKGSFVTRSLILKH